MNFSKLITKHVFDAKQRFVTPTFCHFLLAQKVTPGQPGMKQPIPGPVLRFGFCATVVKDSCPLIT